MSLIPTVVWIWGAVGFIGLLLLFLVLRGAKQQGASEEKIRQQKEVNDALTRASDVQAEHRDPADTERRLRDGTF